MESNQEIQHSLAPTPERTPDQKEIARLKGELDACHHSYLVQTERLCQLKQEVIAFKRELAQQGEVMNQRIAHHTQVIEELQTNLQQQEPRLNEVRNFLHRMGELDMANGKQHPPAS